MNRTPSPMVSHQWSRPDVSGVCLRFMPGSIRVPGAGSLPCDRSRERHRAVKSPTTAARSLPRYGRARERLRYRARLHAPGGTTDRAVRTALPVVYASLARRQWRMSSTGSTHDPRFFGSSAKSRRLRRGLAASRHDGGQSGSACQPPLSFRHRHQAYMVTIVAR
jgi:hypothetical protein